MRKNMMLSYALALSVVFIWSVTFVSTKILRVFVSRRYSLQVASMPIFSFLRYTVLWLLSFRDEAKFVFAGFLGVHSTSCVGEFRPFVQYGIERLLLVSTAPMLTGLVAHFMTKNEKITANFIYGCVLTCGSIFDSLHGHFLLELNPVGDLAMIAALSFAFYSIIARFQLFFLLLIRQ